MRYQVLDNANIEKEKIEYDFFFIIQYADSVLATFQSLKLDDAKSQRNRQKLKAVRSVKDQQKFFAKYLTSEKVMLNRNAHIVPFYRLIHMKNIGSLSSSRENIDYLGSYSL